MKKTFKKLMAALLAVALLCAMAVPAFAADAPGSITISNAVSGKTYNVYRILDIATMTDTPALFIRRMISGLTLSIAPTSNPNTLLPSAMMVSLLLGMI